MAKPRKRYVCQACGSVSSRWQGQCPDCAEWNTLVEDAGAVVTPFSARHNLRSGGRAVELVGLDADIALPPRMGTGIAELDRAVGGAESPRVVSMSRTEVAAASFTGAAPRPRRRARKRT